MTVPDLVQLYRRTVRQQARLQRVAQVAVGGVFLGLLDEADLARVDQAFYDGATERVAGQMVRYDDPRHIRSGLAEWEQEAVQAQFPEGASVVVLGAGAGREVLALNQMGYQATGFEAHPALVRAGRSVLEAEGYGDRLRECDRDRFPAWSGPLDAVVVGWGMYMLIKGSQRRIALLRDAREHLPTDGSVLLSFFPRDAADPNHLRRVHRIASALRRLRSADPVELGDALTPNFAHFFEEGEVRDELAAAGFEMVDFGKRPYGWAVGRAV